MKWDDLAAPQEFALVKFELEVVKFVDEPGVGSHHFLPRSQRDRAFDLHQASGFLCANGDSSFFGKFLTKLKIFRGRFADTLAHSNTQTRSERGNWGIWTGRILSKEDATVTENFERQACDARKKQQSSPSSRASARRSGAASGLS